jgi:hypothetical protein
MDRSYTVAEIDQMRAALFRRHTKDLIAISNGFGVTTFIPRPAMNIAFGAPPGIPSAEISRRVEDELRTYMLAGIGPESFASEPALREEE